MSAHLTALTLSTLGALCWSIQLLPQIHLNHSLKTTAGLQPTMMLLWASAGIPLGIYNITRDFPIPLQIQPQILTLLSLVTWAQTRYYPPGNEGRQKGWTWCVAVCAALCAAAGCIEAGIVFALRNATRDRTDAELESYWPVVLTGAVSAFLLCAGVARHYVDIYRERTVRGISFLFVGIDALGDLTSLLSVVFWWRAGRRLDVLGLVVYGGEFGLWMGVFACGGWYNFRPWIGGKVRGWRSRGGAQHGGVDRGRVDGQGLGQGGEQMRRTSSLNGSVASGSSLGSGTVFRTASDRSVVTGADSGREEGEGSA